MHCFSSLCRQDVEVYNPTSSRIAYELDAVRIRDAVQSQSPTSILECLNPTGYLPPRGHHWLTWRFLPREAQDFSVDIEMLLDQCDTYHFKLTARGCVARDMPLSRAATMPPYADIKPHPLLPEFVQSSVSKPCDPRTVVTIQLFT